MNQTWTRSTAADYCRTLKVGGHPLNGTLLTLDDKEKTAYLRDEILTTFGKPVLIGLMGARLPPPLDKAEPTTKRELKRTWSWDSGAPLIAEQANWGKARNASQYVATQPDAYGKEDKKGIPNIIKGTDYSCVSAVGSSSPAPGWRGQEVGSWSDHPCDEEHAFVCEQPPKGH